MKSFQILSKIWSNLDQKLCLSFVSYHFNISEWLKYERSFHKKFKHCGRNCEKYSTSQTATCVSQKRCFCPETSMIWQVEPQSTAKGSRMEWNTKERHITASQSYQSTILWCTTGHVLRHEQQQLTSHLTNIQSPPGDTTIGPSLSLTWD